MEIKFPFQLIGYRHLNSKKNGKDYTIVEGVVALGERQSICEAFLEGKHHFQSGRYEMRCGVGVSNDKRIEIRVLGVDVIGKPAQ